jgi:hypothetical protein
MRQLILIAFLMFPPVVAAQEDWGWPRLISPDDWFELCGGSALTIGFDSPTITSNDSMLFYRYECSQGLGIAYSIFQNGEWGFPNLIPDTIIGEQAFNPFFAEYDSTLYYCALSDSGNGGDFDIRATQFNGGLWDTARDLGPIINTSSEETSPSMPLDGSRLYFLRNNTIMYSEIIDGHFGDPIALPEVINSPQNEIDPRISPDGMKLYFNRGSNYYDPYPLYVSIFSEGAWQEAIPLGDNINHNYRVPGCEMIPPFRHHPTFSLNGSRMYFGFWAPTPPYCMLLAGIMVSNYSDAVDEDILIPDNIILSAYPNPFNAEIKITVSGEIDQPIELAIYNLAGQKVRVLPSEPEAIWDGKDKEGKSVSSGVYFIRAKSLELSKTIKITLLR